MASFALLLLFALASIQYSYGMDPTYLKAIKDAVMACGADMPVTDDVIEDLAKMAIHFNPEDEKCFLGCMFEKLDIIKGNVYNAEYHKSMTPKKFTDPEIVEKFDSVITTCQDKVKSVDSKCELGYELFICLKNGYEKAGLEI